MGSLVIFLFFPPVMTHHTKKGNKEEWGARRVRCKDTKALGRYKYGPPWLLFQKFANYSTQFVHINYHNGQSTWSQGLLRTWLFWSRRHHHHHHRAAILLNGVHGEGYHHKHIKVGDSFETELTLTTTINYDLWTSSGGTAFEGDCPRRDSSGAGGREGPQVV